ncbi:hypothetical protein ACFYU8_17260 [Brevibacillus sp. NPDC003359]|uniref:hypothetical protein n=1 Tax=unclassified Brevibacillus TaxID=2684853 RepID=UPI0036840EB9
MSNFDTYYGFDTEYIISAGIEEAIKYIKENDLYRISPFFQEKKEELETMYTAEHMERWFQSKARNYPANIEDESLSTLMDRAIDFGNMAEARKLLEKLEEQLGSDKRNYSLLYYRAAQAIFLLEERRFGQKLERDLVGYQLEGEGQQRVFG